MKKKSCSLKEKKATMNFETNLYNNVENDDYIDT